MPCMLPALMNTFISGSSSIPVRAMIVISHQSAQFGQSVRQRVFADIGIIGESVGDGLPDVFRGLK